MNIQRFFPIPPAAAATLRMADRPLTVIDGAIELYRPVGFTQPVWPADHTRVSVDGRMWRLAADHKRLVDAWSYRHPNEFSGIKYALQEFGPARDKSPGVSFVVRPTEWREVRALHEGLSDVGLKSVLPEFLTVLFNRNLSLIPNICSVHAILETADGKLVISQRSQSLHYHPLCWTVSFEEGLARTDLELGDAAIHHAAARGVTEEFLLSDVVSANNFVLLSVVLEHGIFNPAIVAFGTIPYSSDDLLDARCGLPNEQAETESARIEFVPLELDALASVTVDQKVRLPPGTTTLGKWHPTARYRLVAAMVYRFGVEETLRALHQASSAQTGG